MAIRPVTIVETNSNRVALVKWDTMLNGDTGAPFDLARWPDKSVQVVGVFGVGGEVTMEGSFDGGTTWGSLHNVQGAVLAIGVGATENDPLVIAESPPLMRPNVTGGDGSTDVDVYVSAVMKGM